MKKAIVDLWQENGIFYNTEVLKLNNCDYNDGYIAVKSVITVVAAWNSQITCVTFKNVCTIQ